MAAAKSLQLCPTLCDSMDSSPPGSTVSGILQAKILEWVAISFSNACMHAKSLQSCSTLCNPMDSSPPGSSIHRILQTRIPDWVVISFSQINFYTILIPTFNYPNMRITQAPTFSSYHLYFRSVTLLVLTPGSFSYNKKKLLLGKDGKKS